MIDAGNEFGPGTAYGKKLKTTDIGFFNNIKLCFSSSSRWNSLVTFVSIWVDLLYNWALGDQWWGFCPNLETELVVGMVSIFIDG